MPVGVVKTPSQEHHWSEAKKAAAKTKGKSVEGLKGHDWGLVMHIFQNMDKNEGLPEIAKMELNKHLGTNFELAKSIGSLPTDPMKVGTQATVKMPKAKKPPGAFAPPSKFFKSEELENIKKPSIHKLKDFLEKVRSK